MDLVLKIAEILVFIRTEKVKFTRLMVLINYVYTLWTQRGLLFFTAHTLNILLLYGTHFLWQLWRRAQTPSSAAK